jgi:hypothetical protein
VQVPGRNVIGRVAALLPAPPPPPAVKGARLSAFGCAAYMSVAFVTMGAHFALPGARAAWSGHGTSGGTAPSGLQLVGTGSVWIGLAAIALALLWGAAGRRALSAPLLPLRSTGRSTVTVFALANTSSVLLALLATVFAAGMPDIGNYAGGSAEPGPLWASFYYDFSAGFSEEILVVACPVLLVLALRPSLGHRGKALLLTVLVAARLAYHIEYGFMVFTLLPWALIMGLLYLRTRSLIAMICAHSAYDMILDCSRQLAHRYGSPAGWALECAALAASWAACWYWTRRTPGAASAPASALPLPI